MSAFDHATTSGYRRGTAQRGPGRSVGDAIVEEEADSLFYSDFSRCHAAFFQSLGKKLIRIFVLLPGADIDSSAIGSIRDLLTRPAFFECGTDIEGRPLPRKKKTNTPPPPPPPNSSELIE